APWLARAARPLRGPRRARDPPDESVVALPEARAHLGAARVPVRLHARDAELRRRPLRLRPPGLERDRLRRPAHPRRLRDQRESRDRGHGTRRRCVPREAPPERRPPVRWARLLSLLRGRA